MRTLSFTLFVALICSFGFAQKQQIFRIDSLPQQGILLDKNWKFHAGDNPDFVKADFDDSAWESINPLLDVHDTLPQIPRPSGICWFRLHLTIDKNVLNNPLALRISQSGASEIYENGVLVRQFGVLSSNPNEIKAFDPLAKPITFNSNKDTNIVLAVRYTLQPNVHYTSGFSRQNPALQIRLNTSENAFNQYAIWSVRDSNSKIIRIGIYFIIFLLCLSYYFHDPQQKANLYFSIYAVLMIIFDILLTIPNAVDRIFYYYFIGTIALRLGLFLLLTALYFLLNQKRTWIYWSLMGLTILGILVNGWSYHFGNLISSLIVGNLVNIEIVRITFKSIKVKKRGAWIIAVGGIVFLVFFIAFLLSTPIFFNFWTTPFMGTIYTVGDVLYNVALLSIPVAVCVYLGLDIANTNRTLRQKLVEVEALSAENHQILSTQNETLEKQVTERTAELEHKNRDLEIEVALERVRSRTMAMQKSNEVLDIAVILYDELRKLDFTMGLSTINILDYETGDMENWISGYDYDKYPQSFHVPYFGHPSQSAMLSAWRKGEKYFTYELKGEEKQSYDDYMFSQSDFKNFPEEVKKQMKATEIVNFSNAFMKHGAINWAPTPLSDEKAAILQRFASVFEQSYTRFLDLKQAEAQAKEAQIEAALERVRSASLAIHQSHELEKVVVVLFDKLNELGVPFDAAFIYFFEKSTRNIEAWVATKLLPAPIKVNMPYDESVANNPIIVDLWYAIENGEHGLNKSYKEKDKDDYYRYEAKYNQSLIPASVTDLQLEAESWTTTFASEKNSIVGFDSWNGHLTTIEDFQILKRFAKVFEQAYVRFLDLQKAEAQAREAQVEAALEKIRSRSLAMHSSNELKDVMVIMFEKMTELSIVKDGGIGIHLFTEGVKDNVLWVINQLVKPSCISLPYDEKVFSFDSYVSEMFKAKESDADIFNKTRHFEEKNRYFDYVLANNGPDTIPPPVRDFIRAAPSHTYSMAIEKRSSVVVDSWDEQKMTASEFETLKRVARVFEQAYIRFLDLQKAEAQAREAQIEVSLERMRSRAMAMNTSDELNALIGFIYKECSKLDMHLDRSLIMTFDKITNDTRWWVAGPEASDLPMSCFVHYHEYAPSLAILKGWQNREQKWTYLLEGDNKKNWDAYAFEQTGLVELPESLKAGMRSFESIILNASFQNFGCVMLASFEPMTNEHFDLLVRLSKVFDLAYTRFLDLQKAEAQARETQIELALEMIRSRSLAMHKSDELKDVMAVMFQKMKDLDVIMGSIAIQFFDMETKDSDFWVSNDLQNIAKVKQPYDEEIMKGDNYMVDCWAAKVKGENIINKLYTLEQKNTWFDYVFANNDFETIPPHVRELIKQAQSHICTLIIEKNSALFADNWFGQYYSDDKIEVLKRVAKVFEQAYVRFLDLQKAEAQAREAQIEVALERVRSKAMAMQKSEEISLVIGTVYKELMKLDVLLDRCLFMIFDPITLSVTWWLGSDEEISNSRGYYLPHNEHPPHVAYLKAWQERKEKWQYLLEGENKRLYDEFVFKETELAQLPDFIIENMKSIKSVYNFASFQNFGGLVSGSLQPLNDESWDILRRFAKVFDLSYTRFNDLKQAEAQAREAQIEVALERVRSRTMAMQHSNELQEAATLLFQQVQALGIPAWSCGYNIWEKEEKICTGWMSSEGFLQPPFKIPLTESPTFIRFYDSRQKGETFYIEKVEGDALIAHYEYMRNLTVFGEILNEFLNAGFVLPPSQIHHVVNFAHGNLIFITGELVPEAHDIFKRFAKVFEQTYTRFLDLQKAETQALEALKLSSVDRVRAEIASMRTTGDLERITPLIWNELTTLGVPFIRCGVFIMDEVQEQIHTFLSTPDGKAIASFNTSFSNPGLLTEALPHWRNKEIYQTHWDEATFLTQAKTLIEQGAILSPEKYLTESRPTGLYLHLLPFLQGMLYVGNDTAPLTNDQLKLVQTLADAFSAAYARYEDFNKLELAKKQVESTLSELKTTQTQLIQKEKLASLGELTAGIAHEIQNPLNFVNNFSELSVELIEELKVERAKVKEVRDEELENELLNDLAQNQEKINHHGKRASSIVKGMLEHSRQSTGERTLTDINQLADEYLRLSYHGLRAKDNSFNADFELIADADLPKIEVIPQDIGRVLLNLINNAFYAVNKRTKNEKPDYQPKVTIATNYSPIGGWEAIRVKDNGIGMSEATKAKIFQPFFTTKPTGEGTGLGLSLAYDIITKGHGGTIKVESTEGEGTTFVVTLPLGK